jgi:methionine synthase II (cobalamin-independent)
VAAALPARIRDHLDELRAAAPDAAVTVVLDEPALAALSGPGAPEAGREAAREALQAVVSALDVPVGVHCCGDADWSIVTPSRPAVLSWDVAQLGPAFRASVGEVAAAIGAGTRVAWGLVPTDGSALPPATDPVLRYRTVLAELVVAGAPVAPMREDAWATPACGMAGMTVGQAEVVMKRVREIAGVLDDG